MWALFKAAGIVDVCGGEKNFLRSVDEALRATERSPTLEDYRVTEGLTEREQQADDANTAKASQQQQDGGGGGSG